MRYNSYPYFNPSLLSRGIVNMHALNDGLIISRVVLLINKCTSYLNFIHINSIIIFYFT